MVKRSTIPDVEDEVSSLRDEVEQLRTALETSLDESMLIIQDRDRLRKKVAEQSRELLRANRAYGEAVAAIKVSRSPHQEAEIGAAAAEEELRVAIEEMHVLTEELEISNDSLREINLTLDRRVAERTQELKRSELRFRTMVEGMPQLVWRAASAGEWTWASPQWAAYTGLSSEESEGWGWLTAVHPDDRAGAEAAWRLADANGRLDCTYRLRDAENNRYRHFHTRALPVQDARGAVVEWLGTSTDQDDLLRLQERQAVLVAELQHRTRNLMAIVRSVLDRTLRASSNVEEFGQKIGLRMAALARVQGLLSRRADGERVELFAMLREELSAHVSLDDQGRGEQVIVNGPREVLLKAGVVQMLALAIHELATNAVKYGALSVPDGRLELSWRFVTHDQRLRFRLDWLETRPPADPSTAPRESGGGYGRELIERALPYQLQADVTYDLNETGLRCSIEMDVAD